MIVLFPAIKQFFTFALLLNNRHNTQEQFKAIYNLMEQS